jgi:hypothetical protein
MSKQTAVEWLRHQLIENMVCRDPAKGISIMYFHDNAFLDLCRKAKQMEKEQIVDTGNCVAEVVLTDDESYNGNKYWNEFYGGDHE